MKKIVFIVLSLLINLMFITDVNAAYNPYNQYQTYNGVTSVSCTWYAWKNAYELGGVALPGWGNAQTWYQSAINAGYSVGSTAKANSILVMSSSDGYGHVAYVVSFDGEILTTNEGGIYQTEAVYCEDGITVCDYKNVAVNGNGIKDGMRRTIYEVSENLVGYIYLDTVPTTTTTTKASSTTTPAVQEEVKSNNNYLSSITLSTGEIEFNKDTLNYDITVENSVNKINVDATLEDEKSTINGLGEYNLEVGINIIYIDVTAEDTTLKEYVISVTREEVKKDVVKEKKTTSKLKNDSKQNIAIYTGVAAFIVILIILIIVMTKKHKKKKISKNNIKK